jgi:putative nucleotidyltransferase with HDIG domain
MDLDAALAARVKKGAIRVPPSPVVALRMMQLLADEQTPVKALIATLEKDQALTAIVLRLANSAHYKRGFDVASLTQAVLVLGRRALREVSVAKELHERTLHSGVLVALRRRAWRESLACAQVASWVAPMCGANADEAFVAGLLHDIGRVPVIGVLEQLLTEHPEADTRSEDGWWAAVEAHHVELGAVLAKSWGLPAMIAHAITAHHDVEQTSPMLEVLRVADAVVQMMDGEPCLAPAQLGAIAQLTTEQCATLAAQLPMIPATLDAFREPVAEEHGDVIDYEVHLPDGLDPLPQVTLTCEGLVTEADLQVASDERFVVHAQFRPGVLVKVRAGEAHFHARVSASSEGFVELRPWAMDAGQAREWHHFVEGHRSL